MAPRLTDSSIRAINAAHRRALLISRWTRRVLASAAPYLIGIPLMVAIPAGGVVVGLRLAHDPRFAADKAPLVDPFITGGFYVAGAFFTSVQRFGLLATLGIAGFLVLAIFLLCAKLVGALAVTAFRGQPRHKPAASQAPADPIRNTAPDDDPDAVADLDMEAFLRS